MSIDVWQCTEFELSLRKRRANHPNTSYTVRPWYNYTAKAFNSSIATELEMPTPYTEISQDVDFLNDYYSEDGFAVINQPLRAETELSEGDAGNRSIFLQDREDSQSRLLRRSSENFSTFENLLLLSKSLLNYANATVVNGDYIRNLGCFPQFVNLNFSRGNNNELGHARNFRSFLYENKYISYFISLFEQEIWPNPEIVNFNINNSKRIEANLYPIYWKNSEESAEQSQILFELENPVTDIMLETAVYSIDEEYLQTDVYKFYDETMDFLSSRTSLSEDALRNQRTAPLFFRIEKLDENNNFIQNFWLKYPSMDNFEVNFYDTQVLSRKKYKYRLWTYSIVHYRRTGRNYVSIIETREQTKTVAIYQPSLPIPEVLFSNLSHEKNKIRISLSPNKNSHNHNFTGLSNPAQEQEHFQERKQLYDPDGEKENFVYEASRGRYEVYRMTEQPAEGEAYVYSNIVAKSQTGYNPLRVDASYGTSVSFKDTLSIGKKYYYIFRSLNEEGFPSNPTDIYEVELKADVDETFLTSRVVDFSHVDTDRFMLEKTMMKLIQVVPSSYQTTFIPDDEFLDDNPVANLPELNSQGEQIIGIRNEDGTIEEIPESEGGIPLFQESPPSSLEPYNSQQNLPVLGIVPGEHSIWTTRTQTTDGSYEDITQGKKFKIRITSNDTGRKIDFNLKFILTKKYRET
tara:strand:+ start:85 stop:2151 length:2067 start_codon:yes stop_codon:yes gene_type:complete